MLLKDSKGEGEGSKEEKGSKVGLRLKKGASILIENYTNYYKLLLNNKIFQSKSRLSPISYFLFPTSYFLLQFDNLT